MTEPPSDRCGYVTPYAPRWIMSSFDPRRFGPSGPPDWDCCYRMTWDDRNRCVWHAEVDECTEKPIEELRATRETNENRRLNQGEQATRPAEILANAQLQGIRLQDVGLFDHCVLRGADLTSADLRGANLVDTDLNHADLVNAGPKWSSFSDAGLPSADFTDAHLRDADFTEADLRGVDFTDADLGGADFPSTELSNAIFTGASLHYADFTEAELREADLTDATLEGADLTSAYLLDADFTEAGLLGADLTDAYLHSADLSRGNLVNATLENTDMSNASLLGTNLEDANLIRADLSGCTLHGARLFETRLLDVAINGQTTFSDSCIYEQWADTADARSSDQSVVPREVGYIDSETDEVDEERLGQYLYLADRTATTLDDHIQRTRQWRLKRRSLAVVREITRFRRHRQFSSENAHQAIKQMDRAISVYRERQRLYRENSLPEGVSSPYVREKHVHRKRAFVKGNWLNWLKHALARWIMLYGESPWRIVYSSVLLIGLFAVGFPFLGGVTVETTGNAQTFFTPTLYQGPIPTVVSVLFTNFYFSAVTFTTLGYGGMQPAQPATQFLASVESLLGGVMIALFVTVLGRRVMR